MGIFQVGSMELKSPCPSKRRTQHQNNNTSRCSISNCSINYSNGSDKDKESRSSRGSSSSFFSPSCVLPLVVAFIFVFTVAQLILIHRTIVSYKSRHQAFEDCYGVHSNVNDSKILVDLAFSRKFNPSWPNRSSEWSSEQKYPYHLPGLRHQPINHIWSSLCPQNPSSLRGNISTDLMRDIELDDMRRENPQVIQGGKWSPGDCRPRYNVAVIIPYRYRWNHLKSLLSVLHPMLQRQKLAYQIFVAEQNGNYTFNKGVLMNAAFLLAMNSSGNAFDCVIFHDVDLLPEDDRNIYDCYNSPSHLSVAVDVYAYRLPYTSLVGGVFATSVDQFILVNGFSNLYWGWGGEDDDMYLRLIANHLRINRPETSVARYKMLHHGRRLANRFINPLIRTARVRFTQDGLTTCRFRMVVGTSQPLYSHFLIDIGQPSYFVQDKLKSSQSVSDKRLAGGSRKITSSSEELTGSNSNTEDSTTQKLFSAPEFRKIKVSPEVSLALEKYKMKITKEKKIHQTQGDKSLAAALGYKEKSSKSGTTSTKSSVKPSGGGSGNIKNIPSFIKVTPTISTSKIRIGESKNGFLNLPRDGEPLPESPLSPDVPPAREDYSILDDEDLY